MISKQLEEKAINFLKKVEAEAKEYGYREGYEKHKSEADNTSPSDTVISEPQIPEEPVDDPVFGGYSREKVISELLAIKGSKSYAFGIIDGNGNVYADISEWILDNKPEVLGIGFTDGTHHLCMGIKAMASAYYGANGSYKDVFTSTDMWGKVLSDYAGYANTTGIIGVSGDSIAAKCRAVNFGNGSRGYLPAYAELSAYWKRFEEVDVLLKGVGGDVLRTTTGSQAMWTSTNKNDTMSYCLLYYSAAKKSQPVAKAKTERYPTRVFFNL